MLGSWASAIDEYSKAIQLDPSMERAIHKRGESYWRLKQYDLALADLNRAAQLAPNEAEIFCDRGRMLMEQVGWNIYRGEFEKGYSDLKRAFQLNPNEEHAKIAILNADIIRFNRRADTEVEKSNYAEAKRLYGEALALETGNFYALFGRGRTLFLEGKYELAIADYDAFIRGKTDDAAAFSNRGLAKYELGKYDEAIADQTKAIALNPAWVSDAYVRRGRAYWAKKDLINASIDFDNALRLNPNSVFALINKALIFSERKIFDIAIANVTKAMTLKPDDAELYLTRGDIYKASADTPKALADYEQAAKLAPRSNIPYTKRIALFKEAKAVADLVAEYDRYVKAFPLEGLNARGHYYYFAKDYPKALADFHEWNRLDPKSIAALQMLVYSYEETGDPTKALMYSDQVIKLRPGYYDHTIRARILFKLKKYYDASLAIEQALKLDPEDYNALSWRGRLRAEQGDSVGAFDDYGQSLRLFDKSSQTYLFRGMLYAKIGRKVEALADLKKALELDNNNAQAMAELAELTKPSTPKRPKKR